MDNSARIQKVFGAVMILTAVGIYFNYDRKFQTYILDKFPNYGTGLTFIEDNDLIKNELEDMAEGEKVSSDIQTMPKMYPDAAELIPGGQWFNLGENSLEELPELAQNGDALESLGGKVVLIDFWTYTCINCIRTLPYLRDWHESYKDEGLIIIGVHTPEFEFEKDPENVGEAIDDFELGYVVMQDNDYSTWRAYKNRYWPAKYLIDKNGKVRYTHFGEGEYDEAEQMIQDLLSESGEKVEKEIDNPEYDIETLTPELYLGYGRMQYLTPQQKIAADERSDYGAPSSLGQNLFSFDGSWEVNEERSVSEDGSALNLQYYSRNVFLVMNADQPTEVEVYLDGELIGSSFSGEDVADGFVSVEKDRLYGLVSAENANWHLLELKFKGKVEVYAFTFG